MARKRKGRAISGVLLLDKPQGVSSNFILQRVRWLFQAEKAGHGGTLDPFASGLLPILLGEATKFGQYLLGADKRYTVVAKFGHETDTDDCDGHPKRYACVPKLTSIPWHTVLMPFHGKQWQVPPIYSALKVNGKRAYALARAGETPELAAREITVYELTVLEVHDDSVVFAIHCSKGTYIRALIRDIARSIDSAAYAQSLRRTAVGHLNHDMYTFEQLENLKSTQGQSALDSCLLPLTQCVENLPHYHVPIEKIRFIRHGNDIAAPDVIDGVYALFAEEKFFGVGRVVSERLFPDRLCALSPINPD